MSFWTYVQGMMIVEPAGRTQPEKEYILKTVLSHLPEVSGSEGPMQIYINQVQGFDSSSNHDEFFNKSNLGEGRYGRMFHRQDEYILTLNGYLRDRQFSETYKEFMKWIHRFSKRVIVKDCIVRITDLEKDKALLALEKDYQKQIQVLKEKNQSEVDKYQQKYFDLLEQMKVATTPVASKADTTIIETNSNTK